MPGYGGGMSSAKAALESDTRMLAFEAGRMCGARVNAISAGPYASRAASAIGFIGTMIDYAQRNSPLPEADRPRGGRRDRGVPVQPARRPASPAPCVYVDKGFHAMAVAVDAVQSNLK